MTTGSLSGCSESERRWYAARSRWWNSTGGGSGTRPTAGVNASAKGAGVGAVKAGDGGVKFRAEWEAVDRENWAWMERERVDATTGQVVRRPKEEDGGEEKCSPEAMALLKGPHGAGSVDVVGGVVGQAVRGQGGGVVGWMGRHKLLVGFVAVVSFVLMQRLVSGESYR